MSVTIRTRRNFLVAVLGLLAAVVSSASGDDRPGTMGGMGPASNPVVHDPAFFRDKVLPLVERHCIDCHAADDMKNDSKNRLVRRTKGAPWTDEALEANYKNVTKFVDPASPERSVLLLKLVAIANGGIDHDGGKADDEHFPRELIAPAGPLVQWVFGATTASTPPVAVAAPVPRTVELGSAVPLDATLTYDAEGDPVTVEWDVADAPQNARAKVDDARAKKTQIVPDVLGPWTLRCRPADGKLTGWPLRVRFAVVPKKSEPAAASTLATVPQIEIDDATRRVTRQLFLDLWGRSPTADELAHWAALPLETRIDKLLDTTETWQNWFEEEAFYFLLIDQFRPVSDRLVAVPEKLRTGAISFRDAHREFALSSEFNARNPGNDTYVSVVLEQFLGMEVQKHPRVLDAGKKMYDGGVARIFDQKGDNQSDVVKITLAQPSHVEQFLRRMEVRYLGEDLPKSDHEAALSLLASDPKLFRQVLREWLVSDRYLGATRTPKPKNDRQFIRSLFVDLLGRPPAYEEFRNMRNALQAVADPRPVRGVLSKVLLDSGAVLPPAGTDPVDQVRDLFRRLLGRDPDRRELTAFADALRQPGTTWRIPAMALLTSPHYQYY